MIQVVRGVQRKCLCRLRIMSGAAHQPSISRVVARGWQTVPFHVGRIEGERYRGSQLPYTSEIHMSVSVLGELSPAMVTMMRSIDLATVWGRSGSSSIRVVVVRLIYGVPYGTVPCITCVAITWRNPFTVPYGTYCTVLCTWRAPLYGSTVNAFVSQP